MSLPPRLPVPPFVPDPADVAVITTAARRRRARQSGAAAAGVSAALVVLIVTSGGGQAGLSQRELDRPVTPAASVPPTAPPGRPAARAGGGRAPDVVATTRAVTPPRATVAPSTVPARPPLPTAPAVPALPVPEGPDLTVRSVVVGNRTPVPCQATVEGRAVNPAKGVAMGDYCVRWWWAPETEVARGATLYQEYCATADDADAMEYSSPFLSLTGSYYGWESDQSKRPPVAQAKLSAGRCLRWLLRWDGSGRPLGGSGGSEARRQYLPAGTYGVSVSVSQPRAPGGGPTVNSGGVQWGPPGQTTLEIV